MSELILIRHGQATPFEQDTDQLSELGQAQAKAIGNALAGLQPTHIVHGSLVRQRLTAQLAAGGRGWPPPTQDARLNEFDGDGLMQKLAPLLVQQDTGFAALMQDFQARRHTPERNASFQRLLEALVAAWQTETVCHPEVESWADFRDRVETMLREILNLPSGSAVLAFTSGGVIGLLVALVLEAPDSAAAKLNWRVKNGSLTRLTFGGGRISLDSFNEVAHFPAALQSWR